MFRQVSSGKTGIHFINTITESDSVNILDLSNVYNGGGVGVGDFNNDGLQDIYFTGNQGPNKLYLNKGNLQFEDVTDKASVAGAGKWCRGVSVIDINNDGKMDLYVCATIVSSAERRENILYVNQGNNVNGIPIFKEQSRAYGLNDTSYSTNAAFFDFDNDGDLDVFISVNQLMPHQNPNQFKKPVKDGSFPSTCRLLQNDFNDSLKHPYFTNISYKAGINIEGYSHGAVVADINQDGWKDVYVTNDYLSGNVLYINNKDGTFSNKSMEYFKHTSMNAMGQDIIDINNDGLVDVVELDMNPEDNYRKKMMLNPLSYRAFTNSDIFGYQYQYVRNTLQLNQGFALAEGDTVSHPVFSDVSFLAGIAETDWSWAPLVTDFDNDGYRDLIVTNGFPKDVTDHDFIAFRKEAYAIASKENILSQIPVVKIKNYAFHNNGNLTFNNVTTNWGIDVPSFSNGAAYADFDNDGDIDYVVNNIDDEAFFFENTSNELEVPGNYLQINFKGPPQNLQGLGAIATLFYNHKIQSYENTPYRGYLSSIMPGAHFGLGNVTSIDSIQIIWPDGKMQVLQHVKINQSIKADYLNAHLHYVWPTGLPDSNAIFFNITQQVAQGITAKKDDYIDFNYQKLLPHKFSEYGPGIAAGDINNDGIPDMVIGGNYGYSAQILFQQSNGIFTKKELVAGANRTTKPYEDMGMLLFDADGDGDNDLYIGSGGFENAANATNYRDRFYVNDGIGNFTADTTAFPINLTSKSCVKAVDYDNDGDLDLFIGGRVMPANYPLPVSSFMLRNDSKKGTVKFTDVTNLLAPGLKNIGLTCDALFTDFDNDGWVDLIVAGEWMPVEFFKNIHGAFQNISATSGINNQIGWWNSLAGGDVDNDGDIDYIVGNLGKNSFYRASQSFPINIYAKDFDKNGGLDILTSIYLPDKNGKLQQFPAQAKDDEMEQVPSLKKRFLTYQSFAKATINDIYNTDILKDALHLSSNSFESSYIENLGNGKFKLHALPAMAQLAPIFGMVIADVNGDGNLDIAINGNDFGADVGNGRLDALNGLVLIGDGGGNFIPQSIMQSGIYIPGNGKALAALYNRKGDFLMAATQNKGSLQVYKSHSSIKILKPVIDDTYALLTLKNGKIRRQDIYHGNGFLSQSSQFVIMDEQVVKVVFVSNKGVQRTVR